MTGCGNRAIGSEPSRSKIGRALSFPAPAPSLILLQETMPEQQEVKASLGCGTLILIAVIVILFGGHRDHDTLERKIDQLQREVSALRAAVEEQSDRTGGRKPATGNESP